jgi:hypothetical protein
VEYFAPVSIIVFEFRRINKIVGSQLNPSDKSFKA